MSAISDAQLARMRAQVLARLPQSGTIQAASVTSDGYGGNSDTWAAVAGGTVACRLDPYVDGGGKTELPHKEGMVIQYIVTVPYDAPIAANRRFLTGGNTYEIVREAVDHAWNVSRRAYLSRVE